MDKYQKTYFKKNSKNIYKKRNLYKDANPLVRLRCRLSTRTSLAFTNKGWERNSKAHILIGESYEVVFKHIESLFTKGMSWDKLGFIHIDHIIPLSSAINEIELIQLCHYTNLQPLWAKDNLQKGSKIY